MYLYHEKTKNVCGMFPYARGQYACADYQIFTGRGRAKREHNHKITQSFPTDHIASFTDAVR